MSVPAAIAPDEPEGWTLAVRGFRFVREPAPAKPGPGAPGGAPSAELELELRDPDGRLAWRGWSRVGGAAAGEGLPDDAGAARAQALDRAAAALVDRLLAESWGRPHGMP